MAEIMRLAKNDAPPERIEGFVATETGENILRSLRLIRALPGAAMTMIAGAPGVGKTCALQRFKALDDDGLTGGFGSKVHYHSVPRGDGKPTGIAEQLLAQWGKDVSGRSLTWRGEQLLQCIGAGHVLVLDEAQYLTEDGVEWLRAMSEAGQFDLVLSGDLTLSKLVTKIPQLHSRMRRPVRIERVAKGDVAALVAGTVFDLPPAIAALHAAACQHGGLRNVETVLELTRIFAGGDTPNLGHLHAALYDMGLGQKGGEL